MRIENIKQNRINKDSLLLAFSLFAIYFVASMVFININSKPLFIATIFINYLVPFIIFSYYGSQVCLIMFMSLIYVFQNTYLGLGLNFANNINYDNISLAIASSSLFGIMILGIYFVQNRSLKKTFKYKHEKYGLALIIVSIIYIGVGGINLSSALAYERNILLMVLIPIIGRLMAKDHLDTLIRYIFIVSMIIVIFGVIGNFLSIHTWYDFFHADAIIEAKVNTPGSLNGYLKPGFWTTTVFKIQVNRMVSFFYEPVNLAYFLAVAMILAFSFKNVMLTVIFGVGLLLTFGKGGYIIVFITLLTGGLLKEVRTKKVYFWIIIVVISVVSVFSILYIKFFPGATLPHVWGIQSIPNNLISSPLGHGLSAGGNFASIYEGSSLYSTMDTGSESGIGTLVYKMGLPGIILILCYFIYFGQALFQQFLDSKGKYKGLYLLTSGMIISLLIGMVFQENAMGPQANHLLLLVCGACLNRSENK